MKKFACAVNGSLAAAIIAFTALLGASNASAVTYDYTGPSFTSGLIGNDITGSVTLNCAGTCADGVYTFGVTPAFTGYSLATGPSQSISVNTATVGYAPSTNFGAPSVTISAGLITGWRLTLQSNVNLPTIPLLLFTFGSAGDQYNNGLGGATGFSGAAPASDWSLAPSATPLPGALPLFASGLGALGLLGWRRKRKAAAVLAA
jgi:hypothetical protein